MADCSFRTVLEWGRRAWRERKSSLIDFRRSRSGLPCARGVEAGGGAGGADGSKGGHAGVGGPVARSHREQEKERKRREKDERTLVFTRTGFFLLEPVGSLNRLLMTRIVTWRHVAIYFRHVIDNNDWTIKRT
ncbi:hypothetical protein Scep_002754 [Stephania cephalantha]|uniref:Uncharacterized protein n=1 Tax=Stephania cephalantha TaxID=152367 RepID=A0AAP0LAK0_9MAGN